MRIKKGFTLAEVLIVLMVIGAIATMTIPSLMKGVTEQQWKTTYKKAYNALVNLCAMERVTGALPSAPDAASVTRMFDSLVNSLSIKNYSAATVKIDSKAALTTSEFKAGVKYTDPNGATVTKGSATDQIDYSTAGTQSPWMTADDGISYVVLKGAGTSCGTKMDIDVATNTETASQQACVIIVVDVNGLAKLPNMIEPQQSGTLAATTQLTTLTGDQYYIFVGRDGASAGSMKTTVTGRIVGDLK